MQMLARNPAAAYRRVELNARIEASGSAELTRLCLEEAVVALSQAITAQNRSSGVPKASLERSQTILLWLARSVAPDHPLGSSLVQFYGGLARQIGMCLLQPDVGAIAQVRKDISDLLSASQQAQGNVSRETF